MLSILRFLRQSTALGGGDINALTVTNADLDYSESFSPSGMDAVGIFLSPGSTATGTSPTIAAALECSPDGGTTWFAVPIEGGSNTASSTGALSAGSNGSVWVEVPAVESGSASELLYRWAFSYNNADNDFEAVSAWLVGRKFAQLVP